MTKVLDEMQPPSYQEPAAPQDPEAFRRLVLGRRSVRQFLPEAVDPKHIASSIDLALLSPTSSNLMPVEFHWVRSPAARAALVKHCFSQPAAATAQELVVIVSRTGTWRRNAALMIKALETHPNVPKAVFAYYKRVVPGLYTQGPLGVIGLLRGLVVTLVGLFTLVPREPHGKGAMRVWATKSASLAAQTFMLALHSFGLDSCPMEGCDGRRVARSLGLARDAKVAMVIGIGKRKADGIYGPRLRLDRHLFFKEH